MNRACSTVACVSVAVLLIPGRATGEDAKGKTPRVKFLIRLAEKEGGEGLEEMEAPRTKDKIYVHKRAALTNADVAEARVVKNMLGEPAVELVFVKASQKRVGEFSGGNIGKLAAIFIDGKLVSAPVIRAKFSERAEISGALPFTQEEAERISKGLKAE